MLYSGALRGIVSRSRTLRKVAAAGHVRTLAVSPAKFEGSSKSSGYTWMPRAAGALGLLSASVLGAGVAIDTKYETSCEEATNTATIITRAEVAKHKTHDSGIWVTYDGKVYDVTEFVTSHPGGDKILLAAGGALEPFWAIYAVHKEVDLVQELLAEMFIGELPESEKEFTAYDPYIMEPVRHPALVVNSNKPFNAECPESCLTDNFITPNELFFVRNHLAVPECHNLDDFELTVGGEGLRQVTLTMEDLKTKFKKHTVTATLQCAGNRRSQMHAAKPVKGIEWHEGAISNAKWAGVRLKDVLEYAGWNESERVGDRSCVKHVCFEGTDTDESKKPYGASIPIEKATSSHGDVLLAYEMNGEPLPPDHGFPVRVVVPGVVGARNVKWLKNVYTSVDESPSFWQQKDYKGLPPSADFSQIAMELYSSIQELPVQSAICDSELSADGKRCTLKGYAWSGGGRGIVRVDVSVDNGKTWNVATIHDRAHQQYGRAWAWSPWEVELDIPEGSESLNVCCKAVDSSFNVQPDTVLAEWNARGLLTNAWHRLEVKIEKPVQKPKTVVYKK